MTNLRLLKKSPFFVVFIKNLFISLSCTYKPFIRSMDLLNIYFKKGKYNSVQIKQKHIF